MYLVLFILFGPMIIILLHAIWTGTKEGFMNPKYPIPKYPYLGWNGKNRCRRSTKLFVGKKFKFIK